MKYPKINSLDIENKILISSLGIGIITMIFFWVYRQDKMVEGMGILASEPISEGPLDVSGLAGVITGINALTTEIAIETDAEINTILMMEQAELNTAMLESQAEANFVASRAQAEMNKDLVIADVNAAVKQDAIVGALESENSKILTRTQGIADVLGGVADGASQTASLAAANAANQIQNIAQTATNASTTGLFAHSWKIALLAFLGSSVIGAWAISNIEVLIYRITNFKSCFFWYFLEIIGWLLYLPIEFIVWLFCLHDLEKYAWKGLDKVDCFISGITGFYLFKHSDAVNQKCYSKVFTPFPSLAIPFSFDTIGNSLNDLYDQSNAVPAVYGGMDEVQSVVDQSTQAAQIASEAALAMDAVVLATTAAQIGVETAEAASVL